SQAAGALAIITATITPTKLVNTFPSNIRHAARRRGRRVSNSANSTDLTRTATISTRAEPERVAGTMTCIKGKTGSQASAGWATRTISSSAESWNRRLVNRICVFYFYERSGAALVLFGRRLINPRQLVLSGAASDNLRFLISGDQEWIV